MQRFPNIKPLMLNSFLAVSQHGSGFLVLYATTFVARNEHLT